MYCFLCMPSQLADLFEPKFKFQGFSRVPKFTLPTPNEIYKTVREIAERLIDASEDRNAILLSLFPRELDIMDDFVSTIIKYVHFLTVCLSRSVPCYYTVCMW